MGVGDGGGGGGAADGGRWAGVCVHLPIHDNNCYSDVLNAMLRCRLTQQLLKLM